MDHFQNPWGPGGTHYENNPVTGSTPAQTWQQGNAYWTPKSQAELQREGLLQLAVLAAVLVAPAIAGAFGGAGAGVAGAATGASAQAAGGAVGQGAVAGGAGIATSAYLSLGALAALHPFSQPNASKEIAQVARQGIQVLNQRLMASAPFPWAESSLAEWQRPHVHPAAKLVQLVAEKIEHSPELRRQVEGGIPTQQVESAVRNALEAREIREAFPDPVLNISPQSPDSGIIPESWWKGNGFGFGFVAGLADSLVEGGLSIWEMLQLNYLTPWPYYDWIFEGGDTHQAASDKLQLIWAFATDGELRELAAENINDLFHEWIQDATFEGDPSDSGYFYGSLVPEILLALLTDGGYTVKQIITAFKKGGRKLRKLFDDMGSRGGRGYFPTMRDQADVLDYLAKIPEPYRQKLIDDFGKKAFLRVRSDGVLSSTARSIDAENQIYKYATWLIQVDKDLIGSSAFSRWLASRIMDAKSSGLKKIEFYGLSIGNRKLKNLLIRKFGQEGWLVEIIEASGDAAPTIKFSIDLK